MHPKLSEITAPDLHGVGRACTREIGVCTRFTRHVSSLHTEDLLQICHPFQTGNQQRARQIWACTPIMPQASSVHAKIWACTPITPQTSSVHAKIWACTPITPHARSVYAEEPILPSFPEWHEFSLKIHVTYSEQAHNNYSDDIT